MAVTIYMLDANIIIAYAREGALKDAIERRFNLTTATMQPVISVVTKAEALSLSQKFGWGPVKEQKLKDLLDSFFVADINEDPIIDAYVTIDIHCERSGRSMKARKNDLWIAATAHAMNLHLLTTDKDFDHLSPEFITRTWIDETIAGLPSGKP